MKCTDDLDATLSDRFHKDAKMEIFSCNVGNSKFPQAIADKFLIEVKAYTKPMKFYYKFKTVTKNYRGQDYLFHIPASPGDKDEENTIWSEYSNLFGYHEDYHVEN